MDSDALAVGSELERELPLFPNKDFDLVFDKISWPIATRSNVPEEFLRKVLAGSATYQLANTSIDNVYKRYFKNKNFAIHEGKRLDYRVEDFIRLRMELFKAALENLSASSDGPFGRTIAGWTLLRLTFNGKILLTCAQRGALFECAAIARSAVEQIAWAMRVRDLLDTDTIVSISSTKSISELKAVMSSVGQFYGWLSEHTHWAYNAHEKAYYIEEDRHMHIFADSLQKAKSLLVLLIVNEIGFRTLQYLTEEFIQPGAWNSFLGTTKIKTSYTIKQLVEELAVLAKSGSSDDKDLELLASFFEPFEKV